jgi:hypothetical protein
MAPASNRNDPVQRLRFLRFGLIVVVAMAFAIGAAAEMLRTAVTGVDIGAALVQGLIWGVGTAVVAVIVFLLYQKIALKK